jgi:hypothetical protein
MRLSLGSSVVKEDSVEEGTTCSKDVPIQSQGYRDQDGMPPKHQRRSHTKSKRGCSQCKVRRIKVCQLSLSSEYWS